MQRKWDRGAHIRRPRTTTPEPGTEKKSTRTCCDGMEITRPNQVWAMDITYIPMARGFVYLAVVLDGSAVARCRGGCTFTMEAAFCIETLEDAMARHGKPEIFNTDQARSHRHRLHRNTHQPRHCDQHGMAKGAWRTMCSSSDCGAASSTRRFYLRAYDKRFRRPLIRLAVIWLLQRPAPTLEP